MIYGFAAMVIGVSMYLISPDILYDFRYRILLFIGAVIIMILATRYSKNIAGRNFTFREAFRQSWLTYVVGVLIVSIFHFGLESIDTSLLGISKQKAREELQLSARWMHMPEQAVVLEMQKIDNSTKESPGKFIFNTFFSFIFGSVPAFVIALIMRREGKSGPQ
jgi:hypothetical protein